MRFSLALFLLLITLVACSEKGPTSTSKYELATLVSGLEHPWAMAFTPEGDILVTERSGQLRLIHEGLLESAPIEGVPVVAAKGQGGLLDIALHPDFERNKLVYLSYAKPRADGWMTTAIGRGRWQENQLEDFEDILVADAWTPHDFHFGSRLLFDNEGYLFVTVGDRGERDQAQNPGNHIGSTLRLHDDGRIPDNNPFVGNNEGNGAVWTYGNRNAQGMALHPQTGEVWQHEHGPRGGDEINLIRPGLNYGWPEVTHGREYYGPRIGPEDKAGMESPLKHWTPSIAPSGMAFYTGDIFPQWQGDIFVGALAEQHLARVRFTDHTEVEEEQLFKGFARFRDVRDGPDGLIYLLTDEANGKLLVLRPPGD